jgi:general secretion pathway protein C
LQLWGKTEPVAVSVVPQPALTIDQAAVARALGAVKAQPGSVQVAGSAPKVALLGVVGDAKGQGVALLSVDGQAPKPYRVGVEVTDGWRLESVAGRAAVLAAGDKSAPTHRLELPPLKQ